LSVENEKYVYEQALKPWIQREPLENIEKAIQSAKTAPNKAVKWEMKANRMMKKYSTEEVSKNFLSKVWKRIKYANSGTSSEMKDSRSSL